MAIAFSVDAGISGDYGYLPVLRKGFSSSPSPDHCGNFSPLNLRGGGAHYIRRKGGDEVGF